MKHTKPFLLASLFHITLFLLFNLTLAPRLLHAQARRGMTPADTLRVVEVSDAQVSPDGVWIAYVVTTTEAQERRAGLWIVRTVGLSTATSAGVVPLAPPPVQINLGGMSVSRPRWSPDSRRIAFLGTREQASTNATTTERPAAARARQSGIWVVTFAERERPIQPRLVAPVRETNFHIPYAGEAFAWSPDSRRIAFVSAVEEDATHSNASSTTTTTTTGAAAGATNSNTNERRDDPRIIDRIRYKSRTGFSDRARTHVFVADVDDAAPPRQLTTGNFYDHALTWNPRGDEVAFLSNREPDPDANHNSDIFAVDMEGRLRRLTTTRGSEYEPAWSPDGRWIAHTATTRDVTTIDSISEDAHVWIVDASGGGRREVSGTLDRRARSPRWSPDSAAIFFLAGDRGRTLIFRVGAQGGVPLPMFDRFSQDARTMEETLPLYNDATKVPPLPRRPFQTSGFSLSARGVPVFAFTLSDVFHPAEVWVGDASGERARRVTAHNDALLRTLALVEPEDISVRSFDGATVQGWLMKPLDFQATSSRPYPLILRIHGGPHGAYGYGFDATAQAYAARGYAVLSLNPRGSTGYGQKFSDGTFREWGGGDYRDLMAGVDEVLRSHSWIDENRLGVTGGSYGGFMTNWIITQTPRFRAAVASASVSNLISFYGTSLYQDLIHAEFGGFPWDDYEQLWRWSPLRYARAVETPTLFIHGELDNDVHITQAEEMYMALRRRGVEAVLARYPREGHGFREPAHRIDALQRTLDWFDRFLK